MLESVSTARRPSTSRPRYGPIANAYYTDGMVCFRFPTAGFGNLHVENAERQHFINADVPLQLTSHATHDRAKPVDSASLLSSQEMRIILLLRRVEKIWTAMTKFPLCDEVRDADETARESQLTEIQRGSPYVAARQI